MGKRWERRGEGFTLIELLIVVAIIGLLAAMLMPNLLDAMQKAKQKRSIADMRLTGTAMMAWLTDQANAGAAGQDFRLASYATRTEQEMIDLLTPQYIQRIPVLDGWKRPFDYYLNTGDLQSLQIMAIRSRGRDGIGDGNSYTTGGFEPTDYDHDIIWADGYFVRWPQGFDAANTPATP